VVSTELDAAMSSLGITNVSVAARCGVTERTVRDWRAATDGSKAIPYWAVLELPDALRKEMLRVGDGVVMAERMAARAGSR